MARLLLLSPTATSAPEALPALEWLGHSTTVLPMENGSLTSLDSADVLLLDARQDLALARNTGHLIASALVSIPIIFIFTEGGLMAVTPEWGADDFLLVTASPAEVEARIRLCHHRQVEQEHTTISQEYTTGDLLINASSYTARLRGTPLDLTYKEFELLKYLIQHPGRVFTRTQLLQEVWGYDYYGGTRTVDVHVRRLRAKLGVEYETIIGTVRNVGYRFDPPRDRVSANTREHDLESDGDRAPEPDAPVGDGPDPDQYEVLSARSLD